MFIDTHMHIGDDFGVQPDLYVKNATDAQVEVLIASFCEKDDIMLSTKFVEKYKNLYACIGYHPEVSNKIVEKDYEILEEMVKNNPKIVAIGEIGLDYYWNKNNKDKQREVFCKQLEIAEKLKLPVVIHSRDSINETYEILKKYKVSGVIHCFSGSLEMAKKFISLGFLLGIGGVVTFKNSKLFEVIEKLELTNIVLETDSPYLTPEPNRGKTNESSNIFYIAQKIAEIKNISLENVAKITTENAIRTFDLPI
ncbi:TatD family deoxyribonuclease [bacterium]|nr:TatD family deoxyribonuclease [bacterium]